MYFWYQTQTSRGHPKVLEETFVSVITLPMRNEGKNSCAYFIILKQGTYLPNLMLPNDKQMMWRLQVLKEKGSASFSENNSSHIMSKGS